MILLLAVLVAAPAVDVDAQVKSFRTTLESFVKADTTNPPGNEARIVTLIAARLKKEGIPYTISTFAPGRQNIVARLKGSGPEKPILLLAHTDVVGTEHQAWTVPPHQVTEKDGYLYGRGVRDDLSSVVFNLEELVALKRSGVRLRRDVICAWTGDEESGGSGARALLESDPSLADVAFVINEGGSPVNATLGGPVQFVKYQVAEKTYQDYRLTTTGETGHSSVPRASNAIYKLSQALAKLAAYKPEQRLLDATRSYFKGAAPFAEPEYKAAMATIADAKGPLPRDAVAILDKSPIYAATLSTTCVATMLDGGTKNNALPASASANVNCRILPDETVEQVRDRLHGILGDDVEITLAPGFGSAPASPITGELATALTKVYGASVTIIPSMQNGATDSRYFRKRGVPAYGFLPIPSIESDGPRSHGIDERIQVGAIKPALETYHRLMLDLAAVHDAS